MKLLIKTVKVGVPQFQEQNIDEVLEQLTPQNRESLERYLLEAVTRLKANDTEGYFPVRLPGGEVGVLVNAFYAQLLNRHLRRQSLWR
ncbi:MAG: hypothetical protein ABEK59_07385 [Halobacteria archaeon]